MSAEIWQPGTPPITAAAFNDRRHEGSCLAIHFWAAWDAHDKQFDQVIAEIKPRFDGWLEFYCCDVDDSENVEWLKLLGVSSIPMVGVFRDGKLVHRVIGVREEQRLAYELLTGLIVDSSTHDNARPWWKFW